MQVNFTEYLPANTVLDTDEISVLLEDSVVLLKPKNQSELDEFGVHVIKRIDDAGFFTVYGMDILIKFVKENYEVFVISHNNIKTLFNL